MADTTTKTFKDPDTGSNISYATSVNPDITKATNDMQNNTNEVVSSALNTQPDYTGATYDSQKVQQDVSALTPIQSGASYSDNDPLTTVQGQLDKLLASDSPILKRATSMADTYSQATGRMDSSKQATAGALSALYNTAVPIATQDAQTRATFVGNQQNEDYYSSRIQKEATVSAAMTEAQAAVNQRNQNVNNAFQAALQGVTEQNQGILQSEQAKWNTFAQTSLAELDSKLQLMMQDQDLDQQQYNTSMTMASYIMQNAQTNIANMMTDPVLLDTNNPEAVANTINTFISNTQAALRFAGGIAGAGDYFSSWANAWAGNSWVGLDDVVQTG